MCVRLCVCVRVRVRVCACLQRERERETGCACETFAMHMHECVTSKHDGANEASELSQPPPHAYLYNTFGNHPRNRRNDL